MNKAELGVLARGGANLTGSATMRPRYRVQLCPEWARNAKIVHQLVTWDTDWFYLTTGHRHARFGAVEKELGGKFFINLISPIRLTHNSRSVNSF